MNPRIANKLRTQSYTLSRYVSTHQNGNKSKYLTVTCYQKNDNYFSSLGFSNNTFQKRLQPASAPLYLSFQRRNLSNEASIQESAVELSTSITKVTPPGTWSLLFKSFSESKIVEVAQQTLLKVHDVTGLPWWASIALTAYAIRAIITMPFHILQVHNVAKMEMLKPEMEQYIEFAKKEASRAVSYHGLTESTAKKLFRKNVKREFDRLIVEYNCHPFKSHILLLVQLPVWFSFSFAIRNLCYMLPAGDPLAEMTFLEMTVGGFGWVQNLTEVDPYLVLPIVCSLLNLAIIEAHVLFRDPSMKLTRLHRIQRNFLRLLSLIFIPIGMNVPVGMLIYWMSSSSYGLFQIFLFHSSRFQRLFRVPVLKDQPKHPYRLFYSNLKSRLRLTSN